MRRGNIRVMAMGDQHAGHMVGLTHPDFNYSANLKSQLDLKLKRIRKECYDAFREGLKSIGTPDLLFVNGDCIDGKAEKSGGSELIASDLGVQLEIAKAAIAETKCKEVYLSYGTAYHVSSFGEDRERDLVDGKWIRKIGSHEFMDVLGKTFDFKHHVASSGVPQGRATPLLKDMLWNKLWNGDSEMQPLADVTLRSHVHYFQGVTEWYNGRARYGYTLPALQAMGSKFGARRCSGIVHFGFLVFDVSKEGVICTPHISLIESQRATVRKLR